MPATVERPASGSPLPDLRLAIRLRQAARASDVDAALLLIRGLVADERLGCAEKADCLAAGEACPRSLQCVMAAPAFRRLKDQVEDLCDELMRPGDAVLQKTLRRLVDVAPAGARR